MAHSELLQMVRDDKVARVELRSKEIVGELKDSEGNARVVDRGIRIRVRVDRSHALVTS